MEIVFAGFGGQGVLTSGLIVAYIAMKNGYKTLWSPAYGGAMRGGKAFSLVKFDRNRVHVPVISEPDVVIAMNQPSLEFAENLKSGGVLIVNSDLVDESVAINTEAKVLRVPVNTLAGEAKAPRAANMTSVGAMIKATRLFGEDEAVDAICQYFDSKGKGAYNNDNRRAFLAGYNFVS